MTWRGEFRASQGLQTSQNHESVLDVCSVPATDMRQNQPQVDGRATPPTHLPRGHQGNIGHAPGPCQRTSSPHCIRVLRNRVPATGWKSRGWSDTRSHRSVQFSSLTTPNTSIERPDAHLSDGPGRSRNREVLQVHVPRFYESVHFRFN